MNNYSSHRTTPATVRAAIVGHTGYSGSELVRLLERHPHADLLLLDHRQTDGTSEALPKPCAGVARPSPPRVPWSRSVVQQERLDVVFTATPPEVSQEIVPEILAQGARTIDLSGAFRLQTSECYERWYGTAHKHPHLLAQAVYGLPEVHREKIRSACLVANPGCYPTAALCALWPLLRDELVDRAAGVVCDAKSGVTGAGKAPSPKTHFVQVSENFSAYAILKHRHVPEVLRHAGLNEDEFFFTAHLLPVQRGILATHYLRLKRSLSTEQIADVYRTAYQHSPFIRLYPPGNQPQLSAVQFTNFCDLHCTVGADGRRLVVVSCIDNLVKGAAGQAVQNMNLMFGLDETAGLME